MLLLATIYSIQVKTAARRR